MENLQLVELPVGTWTPFKEKHIISNTKNTSVKIKELVKIYHDGHHFVAHKVQKGKTGTRAKREKTDLDNLFDLLYFNGVQQNLRFKQMVDFIINELSESYCLEKTEDLLIYVENSVKRKLNNLHKRKNRFRRKANINKWNYFCTFTFDDKLHTPDTFRKKLRKCLANLHTRRGWKYMGVFELSPVNKRLHFHCIMYIPKGEMVGEIFKKQDYSLSEHKMQTANVNTFFLNAFGRNDMTEIQTNEMTINYILKYIEKTGEKIVYSRGVASEIIKEVSRDDIVAEFEDFILKMVLFDDTIDIDKDIYDTSLILYKDRQPIFRQQKMFA